MAHLPPTLKVQNMNTFWRLGRFFLRKLNCYLIFRYIYLLTYLLTFALYTFLNTKLIISFFIQGLSTQTPVKGWKIRNTTWYTEFFHITCMSRLDSVINFYIMHTFYNGLRSFLIIFSFCANHVYEIYHQISVHTFNMYFWKTA